MQFVHLYDKDYKYGEESQERPCQFSFAKYVKSRNEVQVLNYPVLCRDFLSDTLAWKDKETKTGEKRIYGYKYTGYVDPKKVSLYFKDNRPSTLVDNVDFLVKLEEEIGLKTKTSLFIADGKRELFITADKWWMQTTVHFSFYTYLLRQLSEEGVVKTWDDFKPGKLGNKLPNGVLSKIHLLLKKLVINGVSGCRPEYRGDAYVLHDNNGFVAQFTKPNFTSYGAQLKELLNGIQAS